MMKIKLSATTDKPPIRYRYNGGAWQDSPIFEVPLGAYPYTFEAIDADDCIETFIVTEPPLELFSFGAYFDHDTTEVWVTWTTNIPATSQIEWSFNDDDTLFNTTVETSSLRTRHTVKFPQIALGGSHWFKGRSRSPLNQLVESRYLGIICVPGELTLTASNLIGIGSIETLVLIDGFNAVGNGITVEANSFGFSVQHDGPTTYHEITALAYAGYSTEESTLYGEFFIPT